VTIAAPLKGTATHAIRFWSQDMAGNVEAVNTANLTVAAPATPVVPPAPIVKKHAKLTIPTVPSTVRHRHTFRTSGYMTRHTAGTHVVQLRFYRYKSGRYVYYKTIRPEVSNSMFSEYSKFSAKTSLPYAGKWRVRSVHWDKLHLLTYSGYRYFKVK
jgi:hypothetical protein